VTLLVLLLVTYINMYRKTQSEFTVGLILFSMIACAIVGAIIERIAYRPLRRAPRLTALITAIGVSLFLEYGGQLVFGTDPKPFPQLARSEAPLVRVGQAVVGRQETITVVVTLVLLLALRFIVYDHDRRGVGKSPTKRDSRVR
jgi:branched-chain amino acid transport system permease protein